MGQAQAVADKVLAPCIFTLVDPVADQPAEIVMDKRLGIEWIDMVDDGLYLAGEKKDWAGLQQASAAP